MNENKFYVYEWYNTETNEVFYVGKGCGNRAYETSRRNHKFLEYYNSNSVNVRIIKDKMKEEDAFALEEITINNYKEQGQCTTNITTGGYGGCNFVWTDEMRENKSLNNPMYLERNRERMKNNNPMHDKEIAKKVGAKHKRPIIINGIKYDGLVDAAQTYQVAPTTIGGWLKRGYNPKGEICHYENENNQPLEIFKIKNKCIPVIIDDNNYYESISDAAKAIGVSNSGLRQALAKNRNYCKGHKCRYANQQPSQ